jgi:amidase
MPPSQFAAEFRKGELAMTEDSVGAFIPGERTMRAGAASGPLAGLSFAAKDLFDVAGSVTGYGNPDWAATHAPAIRDAVVIAQLLQAGASLTGKTKTVELAYGLTGENVWQGTPKNPAAPATHPVSSPLRKKSAPNSVGPHASKTSCLSSKVPGLGM